MVDRWSFGSIPVVPYAFAAGLGTATGFTVRVASGRHYLITNYHVLAGRRPDTGAPIDEFGHLPDRVLLALPHLHSGVPTLRWRAHVQALTDENCRPTWAEHPTYGPQFDVVAMPLSHIPDGFGLFLDADEGQHVGVFAGSAISIVGFPHGIAGPALSAIWKTGAIASEPHLLIDGRDFFWIDANTRPGMSGSPVIARRFGGYLTDDGNTVMGGLSDRLLGVYAGRAPDAVDMTLGRVWRWRGVEEILKHAETAVQEGTLLSTPTTVGHFSEVNMPSIANHKGTIQGPPPAPAVNINVADILRQVAGADQRFGMSLDRLKMAAALAASCSAAMSADTVDVPAPTAALLVECLRNPQGWNYPQNFFQVAQIIDQAVQELEAAGKAI